MNSLNNSELDSIKTDLFKNYKVNGYDEALNENSKVRLSYKKFLNWFKDQEYSDLSKKHLDANKLFKITGITFNVY